MDKAILRDLWSTEFAAALLSALVGGLFTCFGAWFQARHTDKTAELALAKANTQRAFDTITQLKMSLEAQTTLGRGTAQGHAAWNQEHQTLITTASSTIMLLTNEHKETRTRSLVLLGQVKAWHGFPVWDEYKVEANPLLSDILKYLGSFLHGSAVPEEREVVEVISREVEHHRRMQMHQELDSLNWEAAEGGLDQEDMERVHEPREQLEISHPVSPA